MLSNVENTLEYDKLKHHLKRYTASGLGNARVDNLSPSDSYDTVQYQQKLCSELKDFHQRTGGISLDGLTDISSTLLHVSKIGSILEPEDFIKIVKVANSLPLSKRNSGNRITMRYRG